MEEKVLGILEEICGDSIVKEDPEINLPGEHLIDSLGYIRLLFELEKTFGIQMSPTEYDRDQMDTPRKIVNAVREKIDE